jgi:para-nitrobenzyl esterase
MRKLADAEQAGLKTAESLGAKNLAELRAKPAEEILKNARGGFPIIDGWFIPDDPGAIFAEGKRNDVPLLAGSNKDEGTFFPCSQVLPTGSFRVRAGASANWPTLF